MQPVPKALGQIAHAASAVTTPLASVLGATSSLLSAAQTFYTSRTSPYKLLLNSILQQLQNFNNDFFGTGVFCLVVTPYTVSKPVRYDALGIPQLTPAQAISAAIASFNDLGDVNRPQFSNSAEVCAFGLLVSAPTLGQFAALINALNALLTVPEFSLLLSRVQALQAPGKKSTAPDWQSVRLNSYPALRDAQKAVNDFISHCKGYVVAGDANIQNLINVIKNKVTRLQNIVKQLQALSNSISNTTGIYVLNLAPQVGGNTLIQTALRDCPLEKSPNTYCAMVLFVGGGPSLAIVNNLRKLMT